MIKSPHRLHECRVVRQTESVWFDLTTGCLRDDAVMQIPPSDRQVRHSIRAAPKASPHPGEEMEAKLYVGNLSYSTTEADLETLFAPAGTVKSVAIVKDRDSGRSKGF